MNDAPLPPYVDEAYLKWFTQEALESFAEIMGGEVGDVEKRIVQRQNEEVAGLRVELSAIRAEMSELRDVVDRLGKRRQKHAG